MKTIIRIPQGAHRSLLPSFRRGWAWLLFLMASVLLTSCRDYYDETATERQNTEDMAMLRINVYAPTSDSYSTRAEDTDPATIAERTMHDLKVWAFLSSGGDDAVAIGYASKSGLNQYEEYQWLEMGLPKGVIRQSLDFYAIANATGTGFEEIDNLGTTPTRSQLENAKFTAFGTTNAVTGGVPATGLPASRILKGVEFPNASENIVSEANQLSILLLRAVGKYRFFFAKPTGFEGQITKIELNENVLPASELMMPAPSTNNATLPHTPSVTLPSGVSMSSAVLTYTANIASNNIKEVDDPEAFLKRTNETFTEYIARLTNTTTGVTEYTNGLTYIRESNAPLKGKIYYKIGNGEEASKEFVLQTEDPDDHSANNAVHHCFPRNHYSVVYAYFKGGGLYVVPMAMPWQWGGELNFFSKTTLQLNVDDQYNIYVDEGEEKKFKYLMYSPDEDGNGEPDYNNWDNNYCAIANGFDGARPKYSPWLVLKTTSMSILQLQTDNTNFGFIVAEKTTDGENTYTYSSILDEVNIPAGKNVVTNFYVVPKGDFNLANPPSRFVNVTLIERNTTGTDEISVHRLPWNSILPGSQSHETAQFYYVTGTEYQQNIDGTVSTLSKQ